MNYNEGISRIEGLLIAYMNVREQVIDRLDTMEVRILNEIKYIRERQEVELEDQEVRHKEAV